MRSEGLQGDDQISKDGQISSREGSTFGLVEQ